MVLDRNLLHHLSVPKPFSVSCNRSFCIGREVRHKFISKNKDEWLVVWVFDAESTT